MRVGTAKELSEIIGAVGLAQNLTALKPLATEGVQKGHMKLHSKNIALMAGAKGEEIDEVAQIIIEEDKVRVDEAERVLQQLRKKGGSS